MSATTSNPPEFPPDRPRRRGALARRGLALACAAWVAFCMLPLVPQFAAEGLDFSWTQALHVAYLQGLDFGSEIVFPFGPLGFAYTRFYWPGTYACVLLFWAIVAAGLLEAWSVLAARMGPEAWLAWPVFALVCTFGAVFINDVPPMAYLVFLVARIEADPPGRARLAAHGAAIGVLALSKLSFALAGGLAAGAAALVLCLKGRRRDAAVLPLAAAATVVAAWVALSQPLLNLPAYLAVAWNVAAGYTEAMAVAGPLWEIVAYAILTAGMLGTAAWALSGRGSAALAVVALFAATTCVLVGKHAFTRHDNHAYIAFVFAVFAALGLAARVAPSGRAVTFSMLAWTLACCVTLGYVTHLRSDRNGLHVLRAMFDRSVQSVRILGNALSGGSPWHEAHERGVARLRSLVPMPALPGSVDVYSYEQAVVFAHGLDWRPRPVFQSYNAYTAELAELNRRHLLGERAPGHLLVRIQPIDGRLAALEDGASWLAMLERYALREDREFLVLDRQPQPAPARLEAPAPWSGSGWKELPGARMVLASIDARDPGAKQIHLRTADGKVRAFRYLSSAARVPFVISPWIANDPDFASLFAPCEGGIGPASVAAVRLSDEAGRDVPYAIQLQAVRELPGFPASVVSPARSTACKLRLVDGPEALRNQPFLADGEFRGVYAMPPSTFGFTRPASRVNVCTRLAAQAVQSGGSDGYALSLRRAGSAVAVAQLRVSPEMVAAGKEACIEARFPEPAADVELRVDPGGHAIWDWIYITRVDLDG